MFASRRFLTVALAAGFVLATGPIQPVAALSGLPLTVTAPAQVTAGKPFQVVATLSNETSSDLTGLRWVFSPNAGWTFITTDRIPSSLAAGATATVTLTATAPVLSETGDDFVSV